MALNNQFADAVVAALNSPPAEEPFSMPFTATSAKTPIYDLKDLSTLRVTVVSRALSSTRAARRAWQRVIPVEIVVQKKIEYPGDTPRTNAERMEQMQTLTAPLDDFVESLVGYLEDREIEGRRPTEIEQLLYDEDALLDHEYFSMIRFSYVQV